MCELLKQSRIVVFWPCEQLQILFPDGMQEESDTI
jgi:hypothetical protein